MWKPVLRHVLRGAVYGSLFAVVAGAGFHSWTLQNRPELAPWHLEVLDAEFRVERVESGQVTNFVGYQILEAELFRELRAKVYDAVPASDRSALDRFATGSLTDPESIVPNWNRSIERSQPDPSAAVLLIHGLSDSPYSMRALAETLSAHNAWVLAFRVPGHGTAPAGLTNIDWQSFAAATRLAAIHLAEQVGEDVPLYLLGYSNGATLAVHYALTARDDPSLPTPAGLVLLAPAIEISRAAAFAVWQARLGAWLGLDKVAWKSILPEYDPYKYQSFAVNAGEQMYQLTRAIRAQLDAEEDTEATAAGDAKGDTEGRARGIEGFPRTLVFDSVVDATVVSEAVVTRLLARLAPDGHELVLFDLNRYARLEPFLRGDPGRWRDALAADDTLPFAFTLVTNVDPQSREVLARRRGAAGGPVEEWRLDLAWPQGVYSLSHVAIPFRPDDPWYGYDPPPETRVALGRLAPRGERGVLIVPATDAMRLRSNPFFDYLERRVVDFMSLGRPLGEVLRKAKGKAGGRSVADLSADHVPVDTR